MEKTVYDFSAVTITGEEMELKDLSGKVLLIVNTASRCGFTSQYKGLQALYEKYRDKGFVVLGFPCNQFLNQEPGTDEDIKDFCEINFGVTFPLFSRIDVNGRHAHPLFTFLKEQTPGLITRSIKWNFTKFLVDRNGRPTKRFSPATAPVKIAADIEKLI